MAFLASKLKKQNVITGQEGDNKYCLIQNSNNSF